MKEKDYYGAIKGFCMKWNLPEVWNSDRITGTNLIYEVIKVINAMILEQKEVKEMVEDFLLMFNEDLSDTVKDQLTVWLNDGTLGDIINETLFNSKLDKDVFEDFEVSTNKKLLGVSTNVKEYGAIGDGVTDDTQAFINALAENNTVIVPEGVYNISNSIKLKRNKSLVGISDRSRDIGSGSILKYVGNADSKLAVILVGQNNVGDEPTIDSSQIILKNISIDCNKKCGFGVYGTYLTNETLVENVSVVNSTEYGFYFAKAWYATFSRLVSTKSDNVGQAYGMPLLYSDGSEVVWSTQAPLEMNQCVIDNIRSHSCGQNYSVKSPNTFNPVTDYRKGYGIGFGFGNGIRMTNLLSEANGGVGLLYYNHGQPIKTLEKGYLENNCYNSGLLPESTMVNLFIENLSANGGSVVIRDLFLNYNSGGIMFKGNVGRKIRCYNVHQPRFLKSVDGLSIIELAELFIKSNCYYLMGSYNYDIPNASFNTFEKVDTRYSFQVDLNNPNGYVAILARKTDSVAYGTVLVNRILPPVTYSLANLTDEFTLLGVSNNVISLTKGGTTGSQVAGVEFRILNIERTDS